MKTLHALAIGALLLAPGLQGCNKWRSFKGEVKHEARAVSSFSRIFISSAFNVVLVKGSTAAIDIDAPADALEYIETEVRGSELRVRMKPSLAHAFSEAPTVRITYTSDIELLDVEGAVELRAEQPLVGKQLEIRGSGASHLNLAVNVEHLDIDLSGATEATLSGKAVSCETEASGASEIRAFDLDVDSLNLDISGAADVHIKVNKDLKAEVSGGASLQYKGSPMLSNVEASGAGAISKVG